MTKTTAPAVSRQAARALQLANHVLRAQAKLKTRIATGDLAAAERLSPDKREGRTEQMFEFRHR